MLLSVTRYVSRRLRRGLSHLNAYHSRMIIGVKIDRFTSSGAACHGYQSLTGPRMAIVSYGANASLYFVVIID